MRETREHSRSRPRRARAALAWSFLFCVLLHPGLGLVLATWAPALTDPDYGHRLTLLRKRLASPDRSLTVVMVGSSRTALGFLPTSFEKSLSRALGRPVKAFNFGIFSAGPVTNLVEVRRLLHDGVRPDLLLLEVLPTRLNGRLPLADHAEVTFSPEHLRWDDLPVVSRYDPAGRKHLRRDWLSSVASPWYAHRVRLAARVCPGLLTPERRLTFTHANVDASGVTTQNWDNAPAGLQTRWQALVRRDCPVVLSDFHLGGGSCSALHEILELCQRENQAVALVLMPEASLFRSWYRAEGWAQVHAFLRALEQRYQVPVINAREWVVEEDFADYHHLLRAGAEVFSERLAREAVAPLLGSGVVTFSKKR